MKQRRSVHALVAFAFFAATAATARAADQTAPGAGNADAIAIARASPLIRSAFDAIRREIRLIDDAKIATETRDLVENEAVCVQHRAGLDDAAKNAIVAQL